MGDFNSHITLAKEKGEAAKDEYIKRRYSATADLAYKACEQAVQAELARIGGKVKTVNDDFDCSKCPKDLPIVYCRVYMRYLKASYGTEDENHE